MKLSDFVFRFVEGLGVKHVFMLSGGGVMHLVDSLGKSKLKYICGLHEQAASIATCAYAQYNGFGVCLVTTGPGGTNAVTGVVAAWLDSIPCLFISGQVKRSDIKKDTRQLGFQEIGIVDIVKSITKYAVIVTDPNSILYHLEKAVHLAETGRPAPVWIDIPLDVQASEIDETKLKGYEDSELSYIDSVLLKEDVAKVVELLNSSKRPIFLIGEGVRGSISDFLSLVYDLKYPILTTWRAMDLLSETHPLYVGRPGAVGQRGANFALQNADLLISIGARLDFGQTGYSYDNFARNAKKVVVDIDSAELNKGKIDVPICANAGDFIRELRKQRYDVTHHDKNGWLKQCKEWQAKYPVVQKEYWDEKFVNNYALIDVLSEEMNGDDVLIPASAGQASEITLQSFRVKEGQRIFNMPALGAMGFGICSALGACLASSRRTVCIEGDGGFVMMTQELETIKRLKLPIKFFVLNNNGYNSIRNTQNAYFQHLVGCDSSSGLTLPRISRIANAYGIYYTKIDNHEHIKEQVKEVLNYDGAIICEVMINPNQQTEPRIKSKQNEDGSMSSGLLEDMYPYLSREEFNMEMSK